MEKFIAFIERIEETMAMAIYNVMEAMLAPRFLRMFWFTILIALIAFSHWALQAGERGHAPRFAFFLGWVAVLLYMVTTLINVRVPVRTLDEVGHNRFPIFPAMRREDWLRFGRGQYVYIIQDVDVTGFCKIGKTVSVRRRMHRFEVVLPFRFRVLHIIPCADALIFEAHLHRHFAAQRMSGEWFQLTSADIEWLKSTNTAQSAMEGI